MSSVALPPDDGAIKAALTDLDARLAAWAKAMRSLQQTQASAGRLETATDSAAAAPQNPVTVSTSGLAVPAPMASTPPAGDQETGIHLGEEATVQLSKSPRGENGTQRVPATVQQGIASSPDMEAANRPAPQPAAAFVQQEPRAAGPGDQRPEPDPAVVNRQEDELLLQSLDEETAKAIRVMRRLDPGNKQVRELLEEYRAGAGTKSTPPTKNNSWWSRGRG